jgi:uncharacterized LabA/DUF88 family protein
VIAVRRHGFLPIWGLHDGLRSVTSTLTTVFRLSVASAQQLWWPRDMGGEQVVHPRTGQPFELVQQKAVDVGLATHLMRSHAKRGWRKLFLAAGDSDFHEPVQNLVEHENVDLVLIGTLRTISTELQPYARDILRIDELAEQLARVRPLRQP